jgi:hypothetical protein
MTAFNHRCLRLCSLVALVALPLVPGCDTPLDLAPLRDGLTACDELVAYCEAPAAALGEPYQTCFETGDAKVGNACLHIYYDCMPDCRIAGENLGGAGGEGGASSAAGEGGAGGAS